MGQGNNYVWSPRNNDCCQYSPGGIQWANRHCNGSYEHISSSHGGPQECINQVIADPRCHGNWFFHNERHSSRGIGLCYCQTTDGCSPCCEGYDIRQINKGNCVNIVG